MKGSLFAFGTALAVVAGVILLRFHSQSGATEQRPPAVGSPARESESQPSAAQPMPPVTTISPALPVTRSPSPSPSPSPPSPPSPSSLDGTEPHEPPSYDALVTRFQAEARDEAWASAFERKIKAALGTPPRSMVERVECKTSVCTITVVHGDALAYEAWATSSSAAIDSSAALAMRRIDGDDGSVRTESMLSASDREP